MTNLFCTISIRPSWGAGLVEALRLLVTELVGRAVLFLVVSCLGVLSLSRLLEPVGADGFLVRLLAPGFRADDILTMMSCSVIK